MCSVEDDLNVNGQYTAEKLKSLAAEVSFGLCWMWREGMFHRDIKTGNLILRQDRKSIMIADLGSSTMRNRAVSTVAGGTVGTHDFSAPEVFDEHGNITDGERYTVMSDVCSFGLVLVRALCKNMKELSGIARSLRTNSPHRMHGVERLMENCNGMSEELKSLIRGCLDYRVEDRMKPHEIWKAMDGTLGTSWQKDCPAYRIMLWRELKRPELGSEFDDMPQWWRIIEHTNGKLYLIPLCSKTKESVRHTSHELKPFELPTTTRAKTNIAIQYFAQLLVTAATDMFSPLAIFS